jgi:hypothetical protein
MSGRTDNPARDAADQAENAADQVNESVWFDRAVRLGLVAYGVIHILIGWLALQLAFGDGSGAPDQQGALEQLAQQTGGGVLLWAIGIGLMILAIWQLFEAVRGHRGRDQPVRTFKRVGSAGRVVLYVVIGISALRTATDSSSSSGKTEDTFTAKLMEQTAGQWLVAGVGAIIVFVAVVIARRGLIGSFERDLQVKAVVGRSGTTVLTLGAFGYVSKGFAVAIVGGLFVWAAWDHDPKKAGGLDTALRKVLDQSYGPVLLIVIALGIVAFGLYCFAWARYADTDS